MIVEQSTLEKILEGYVPAARYLKSAELNYPEICGEFKIPAAFYFDTKGEQGHFTAVEMVICLNQIGYLFFYEVFRQGLIEGIPPQSEEEYKHLQRHGILITGYNNVRFKKMVDASKEFDGRLKLVEVTPKRDNTLYFLRFDYDFAEGKVTGEVQGAVVLGNKHGTGS